MVVESGETEAPHQRQWWSTSLQHRATSIRGASASGEVLRARSSCVRCTSAFCGEVHRACSSRVRGTSASGGVFTRAAVIQAPTPMVEYLALAPSDVQAPPPVVESVTQCHTPVIPLSLQMPRTCLRLKTCTSSLQYRSRVRSP